MNRVDVLSVVPREKHKLETTVVMCVQNAKCLLQHVLLVVKLQLFLLDPVVISLYIAEIVINLAAEIN